MLTTALVVVPRPVMVLVCAVVVAAASLVAGLGFMGVWRLVRPLRWVVALLAPFQVWFAGFERGFVVVGGLVVVVAAAGIVTCTTRSEDMLDAVTSGLRACRWAGVDPERVALLFSLVLRSVPVVAGIAETSRQARIARGLHRSPRALLVPVVVRSVRHAEALGDALVARGVDD